MSSADWMLIALIVAGLLLIGLFLYWLLVTTEGVYLGRRAVVWLYDVTAHRYDDIKEYDPADECLLVTRPVLNALHGVSRPRLLDVATGTGRVPFDLSQSPYFSGHIVALDDSRRMLDVARQKLASYQGHVEFVNHSAVPLPFPDEHFDAVTCLEALEFFPSDAAAVCEMVRVLRPASYLLVTRRCGREGRLFLHRYRSRDSMRQMLEEAGLRQVQFHPWQVNYDLVTALKPHS